MRITVFAGSSDRAAPAHRAIARALGAEIARRGHVLVYGGGRTGLMGELADAALAEKGTVLGVILREFIEQDVHHLGVEDLYAVDDMRARKAGLDERADAFIALPGGFGTFEELTEILSFRKLGFHNRPLVLLDVEGFYQPFVRLAESAVAAGFEKPARLAYFTLTDDPKRAVDCCEGGRG